MGQADTFTMALEIYDLLQQYPLLTTLTEYLSTTDLINLGLTSRAHHALILKSAEVFNTLKRSCLCDGSGLRHRIERVERDHWKYWGSRINGDEEIEVRLFSRKCDESGALPCTRCGVNVCEECRVCPRTISDYGPQTRPHLTPSWCSQTIMCLCEPCDARTEQELVGKFLNPFCDCDIYKRWICRKCFEFEEKEATHYYENHTISEADNWEKYCNMVDKTKVMSDHANDRLFFCTCGSTVPKNTAFRCTLCKRRHRSEFEWCAEYNEMRTNVPGHVDDYGAYPIYSRVYESGGNWNGYPRLRYSGPIYQG
ncbi:hypothetical protein HJFPF1_02190 [Paramyrothecium foliicola]|nr:hypothetical protein HJFPF1_02190 [Paramyrothecium foliicola]